MKHLLLAAVLVLAAACGGQGNKLTHGKVIEKSYDDPDSWTTLVCAAYGQNGICTVYVTQTHHDPAHWELRIRGYDTDEKVRKEWHEVSEATYLSLEVGDQWSVEP